MASSRGTDTFEKQTRWKERRQRELVEVAKRQNDAEMEGATCKSLREAGALVALHV